MCYNIVITVFYGRNPLLKGLKMPSFIEKAEQISLPVAVLHGAVAFPSVPINFEVLDEVSSVGIKTAGANNAFIFLVSVAEHVSASATPEPS